MPANVQDRPGRIGEIDGLRGVALTLVVLFHVFGGGRVSGGVDVFLVITGFLTTRAVLRRATTGRLTLPAFWSRDLVRLAPTAVVVLLAVVAGTFSLFPPGRWESLLREVAASAMSWENWRLIDAELAYGAAGPDASPLQHFWSLAVQVQYLVVLPLVALGCVVVAARIRRYRGRGIAAERLFGGLLGVVTTASFGYAVWLTTADQPVAYLHTYARIWEIGAGGLLALAVTRLRMPPGLRVAAGWTGLTAVVACGFLFDGGRLFPGPATLFPVAGALLVLTAADASGYRGRSEAAGLGLLSRVLDNPFPRWLATISFALYLWHWPLLVAWLTATGRPRAGVLDGAAVVAVSALLAWATLRWVARPVERWASGAGGGRARRSGSGADDGRAQGTGARAGDGADDGRGRESGSGAVSGGLAVARARRRPVGVGAVLGVVSVLLAGGAWAGASGIERGDAAELAALREPSAAHPGAAALRPSRSGDAALADVPFRPSARVAARDGRHLPDCSNHDKKSSEVVTCVIAAPESGEPTRRVYLVGGSHTQHWSDAWVQVAAGAGWELTSVIKQGCRLTVGGNASHEFCVGWSAGALGQVIADQPDAVIVESTKTSPDETDVVVPEQAAAWEAMRKAGVQVIGVRDIPRFAGSVPDCLAEHRGLPHDDAMAACSAERGSLFGDEFPAYTAGFDPTVAGIAHLDLTDAICGPNTCGPVVGNVLVYRDDDHLTGTYAQTLGPDLDVAVRAAVPHLFADRAHTND